MSRLTAQKALCICAFLMSFFVGMASAQGTKTVAVKVSDKTQTINGKEYYIHIAEQGQTLFSIARAYGLKYYDAVIKTDIHLMKVGDTVWLPKNDQSVAAVMANAQAVTAPTNRVHYIKIEPGQTLYGLSREYGVTVDQIIEANPELKTEQLKAGQMLKIPPKGTENGEVRTESGERRTENAAREAEAQRQAEQKAREEQARLEAQRQAEQKAREEQARLEAQRQEEQKAREEQARLEAQRQAEQKAREEQARAEAAKKPVAETSPVVAPSQSNTSVGNGESTDASALPMRRQVVNPYPFAEVPNEFPSTQAPYYNFSTVSSFNYQVRDRQSVDRIFVTVVMPLNLNRINEISTSKFDIEQRGKKEYKVFEFIQFYEGILMAMEELQNQGLNVVLNVVDLTSDKDEDVVAAFNSHNVANSDFVIALLVKKPFAKLAELAKQHQVFVINPFSSRVEVVKDNPYVVKCMPSIEGTVSGLLDIVAKRHKGGNLYILHSNNKSSVTDEREFYDELQRQLESRKDIKYTFFDWSANAKLVPTLKTTTDNVIISIFDQDKNKNTVYATTLLNRLSAMNKNMPELMTTTNYLTEYPNVDFEQLQHLNYTTVTMGYLDYNNFKHKEFINTYKDKFRTEPNTLYAGVAHDIMLYFSTALWRYGAEFWRNPQKFTSPSGLLFPFNFKQSSPTGGYENQTPDIYRMSNYKLVPAN